MIYRIIKRVFDFVCALLALVVLSPIFLLTMIVMGDMNDFDTSAPLDSLKEAGMKNAWWEGGIGYGATYHEGWLRLRIDHIYYNEKLELKDVKVVKTDLSDHNVLIADFSIAN